MPTEVQLHAPQDYLGTDISAAIVPVFQRLAVGHLRVLGTAFFIDGRGILLTARHLFDDVDPSGLYIAQNVPHLGLVFIRSIEHLAFKQNRCDVALASVTGIKRISTNEEFKGPSVVLTSRARTVRDRIFTYAYTRGEIFHDGVIEKVSFGSNYYHGRLVEHHEKRDSIMLPTSAWETNMHILPGASGGPVFNEFGHVFAINSSSFSNQTDLSYISEIWPALNLQIVNGNIEGRFGKKAPTLSDLLDAGFLRMQP